MNADQQAFYSQPPGAADVVFPFRLSSIFFAFGTLAHACHLPAYNVQKSGIV
jgi:hypothetical protein